MKIPVFCSLPLLILLLITPHGASGRQTEASAKPAERMITIFAVSGNRIRFSEATAGGRGRGRRGGMTQAQPDQQMPASRGRRGRGMQSGRGATNQLKTLSMPESAIVTYAMTERRTNEFKVGSNVNGRLRNQIFRNIPTNGMPARIVIEGNQIVQLNVIQANDTSLDDIAVKPKRPPRRK